MLPCRPESAQREFSWRNSTELSVLKLQIVGCETQGHLFSISHIEKPRGSSGAELKQQWMGLVTTKLTEQGIDWIDQAQPIWINPKIPIDQTWLMSLASPSQTISVQAVWFETPTHVFYAQAYSNRTTAMSQQASETFFSSFELP
jgi:hypothetical protein